MSDKSNTNIFNKKIYYSNNVSYFCYSIIKLKEMNEEHLIEEAKKIHYTQWSLIDEIIKRAKYKRTVEKLNAIKKHLYNREEYYLEPKYLF